MKERYIFSGKLTCVTGLHLGSGRGSQQTDAAVMVDLQGCPLIPGSSLKGVMRSTVEMLGQVLGPWGIYKSCVLFEKSDQINCLTCNDKLSNQYEQKREIGDKEENLLAFLLGDGSKDGSSNGNLCDTCRVFGSPYYASKVRLSDAKANNWDSARQPDVRHGVGIDRDTETARKNIKYDFEVVQRNTEFDFELIVEDVSSKEMGLVCLALSELVRGGIRLGGIKSRGLGKMILKLDDKLKVIRFGDTKSLLNYLCSGEFEELSTKEFLNDNLQMLLQKESVTGA